MDKDITCPHCGRTEAPGRLCSGCGYDYQSGQAPSVKMPALIRSPIAKRVPAKPEHRPLAGIEAALGPVLDGVDDTREGWMLRAIAAVTPLLAEATDDPIPPVRVSFGWPGGRGNRKGVRGQCWHPATVDDGVPAIFISPDQSDTTLIVGILLHEMNHAVGHFEHRGAFATTAKALGYTAPYTDSANRTPELTAKLEAIAADLGPLKHAAVNQRVGHLGTGTTRPPVQTTRMIKLTCPEDGYLVRTTAKWIEVGLPACPEGHTMEVDQ